MQNKVIFGFDFLCFTHNNLIIDTIKINVNQQMDDYTFSIGLSMKELIKHWFPNARPANLIFVAYDIKSDFGIYLDKFENYISRFIGY